MFNVFGELNLYQSMQLVKHNSVGVGLNCSKILTEALNGKIEFVNTSSEGVCIRVRIPVKVNKAIVNRKLSSKYEHVQNQISGEKLRDDDDIVLQNLLGRKIPTQRVMSSQNLSKMIPLRKSPQKKESSNSKASEMIRIETQDLASDSS